MQWVNLLGFASVLGMLWTQGVGAAAGTQAQLVLSAESAGPGETVMAGIRLRMPDKWHTYWRNPGDSGGPTKVEWALPAGITAGELQWPIPEKYFALDQWTYVYHGEVLLLAPLNISATVPAGKVDISAKVSWLECEVQCIPGKATVTASLTVGSPAKPSADADLISSWRKKVPSEKHNLQVTGAWDGPHASKRDLTIQVAGAQKPLDFFPYESETFDVKPQTSPVEGQGVGLRKQVEKLEGDWPKEIRGLIVQNPGGPNQTGYEVVITPGRGPAAVTSSKGGLMAMLGFAFLGGLILNIMPCVLPVIALKVLGFVQHSKESPGKVRQLGIVYGLGVLFSFLLLAGLIIAVQGPGRSASWGMQFQNPQFVVAMIVLVTLVALNLFGLFEVNLTGGIMDAAGNLASRQGYAGAFFNGILATVLATPCTAPFLSVALGFAFVQPPQVIVLVFLMIGAGLAFPYVILSFFPQWVRWLPKPGAWMEKFKILMGFPMLATAVWLLTLTTPHFGSAGPLWVGLFLVVLALAAWIWGQTVQRGGNRAGMLVAASLVLGAYLYAFEKELHWRNPASEGIDWKPWSVAAVEEAQSQGKVVLVDFTADWCLTCKANKKSSLEIPAVRKKLKEINAIALRGDFTKEDPQIAAELRRYERAGVPLNLVYPGEPKTAPVVLPTVLTPGIVLDALAKAAQISTNKPAANPSLSLTR